MVTRAGRVLLGTVLATQVTLVDNTKGGIVPHSFLDLEDGARGKVGHEASIMFYRREQSARLSPGAGCICMQGMR